MRYTPLHRQAIYNFLFIREYVFQADVSLSALLSILICFSQYSPTTVVFSRFVFPGRPSGTPAVRTTTSPYFTYPARSAASVACRNKISMLYSSLMWTGSTPHDRLSWRHVHSSGEHPTIWHPGLYFEIIFAVCPDLLTVMIALASRSIAVMHVACEIAVVISGRSSF